MPAFGEFAKCIMKPTVILMIIAALVGGGAFFARSCSGQQTSVPTNNITISGAASHQIAPVPQEKLPAQAGMDPTPESGPFCYYQPPPPFNPDQMRLSLRTVGRAQSRERDPMHPYGICDDELLSDQGMRSLG